MDRRVFLAGSLAVVAPRFAEARGGWVLLGTTVIDWGMTRGRIRVNRTRGAMSDLSFRTRGGEVLITDLEIFFSQGRSQRVPQSVRVTPSMRSNQIPLGSRGRPVSRIEFSYRKSRRQVATTVELYGRRA